MLDVMFQSSPVRMGRALRVRILILLACSGFNPRPSAWDGRSYRNQPVAGGLVVSILARPHGTGARQVFADDEEVKKFQSSPVRMGRALYLK